MEPKRHCQQLLCGIQCIYYHISIHHILARQRRLSNNTTIVLYLSIHSLAVSEVKAVLSSGLIRFI